MTVDALSLYSPGTGGASQGSKTAGKSNLSMDDFIKLMVAQMSNQDMNNPMDNTQFLTQMAQFSMIQALADMQNTSLTGYSIGLVGKEVTVATHGSDGTLQSVTGLVEAVNLFQGKAKIVVEGVPYDLSSVMVVRESKSLIPEVKPAEEELPAEKPEIPATELPEAGEPVPEEPDAEGGRP